MLNVVTERYGGRVPEAERWFWAETGPVRALPSGRTLVVQDAQPFTLHFGFDDWQGVAERGAEPLGLGMFGVTLTPADLEGHGTLQFVRRYADGHWEASSRNDVRLNVEPPSSLPLPAPERGRVAAAGPRV